MSTASMGQGLLDTRDMIVVHTALLREIRLAPALVRSSPPDDSRRTRVVAEHLDFLLDLLEHHHTGEDRLLWPVLRQRLPDELAPVIELMTSQHEQVQQASEAVSAALKQWRG